MSAKTAAPARGDREARPLERGGYFCDARPAVQ